MLDRGADKAILENLQALREYPLYPYLMYRWLRNNLHLTEQVRAFLADFPDSRHAALLREDWLAYLAEHRQWPIFLEHYRNTGNPSLECAYHWALHQSGRQRQALTGAGGLWLKMRQPWPQQCRPLFRALLHSKQLTEDLLWQKFTRELQRRNLNSANRLRKWLPPAARKVADFWISIDRDPALVEGYAAWDRNMPQAGRIFSHGIQRLARRDLEKAISLWDSGKYSFHLTHHQIDEMDKKLAIRLVQSRNRSAYDRFRRLFSNDQEVREWRVRATLLEQNWQHVDEALKRLTNQEKRLPKWQYWQARAYWQLGEKRQARKIFHKRVATS